MKDFMGTEIYLGTWVASGGAGNRSAEYGMILHIVAETHPKLKLKRLDVSYPNASEKGMIVKVRKTVCTNHNKLVVVDPPDIIRELFEKADNGELTQKEKVLIGNWVHGADHQRPWGK